MSLAAQVDLFYFELTQVDETLKKKEPTPEDVDELYDRIEFAIVYNNLKNGFWSNLFLRKTDDGELKLPLREQFLLKYVGVHAKLQREKIENPPKNLSEKLLRAPKHVIPWLKGYAAKVISNASRIEGTIMAATIMFAPGPLATIPSSMYVLGPEVGVIVGAALGTIKYLTPLAYSSIIYRRH
jgi:hypothetical protein